MANIVSMLIEKPSAASTPKVPSSTIGTAMVGISVARKLCRNRNITRKTSTIASSSVLTTPSIATRTKGVVSKGTTASSPGGKKFFSSARRCSTPRAVSSAFAPEVSDTATPVAGLPL
mgnify:CR=1 FL=1